MYNNDRRNYEIVNFLTVKGDSEFGKISKHLESKNLGYAKNKDGSTNTKGLAKKLITLDTQNIIKKIKHKPYPVYRALKNQEINFAIAGDNFGLVELSNTLFRNMGEAEIYPEDSYELKLIKKTVSKFGFYVLASLVENLDYWIKTNGRKNDLRKIWLKQALDLSKYQESIFEGFLSHLTEDSVNEESIQKNKQIIQKRINKVKKSMKALYPNSYKKLIQSYEIFWQKDLTLPDRLRVDSKYSEHIPKDI